MSFAEDLSKRSEELGVTEMRPGFFVRKKGNEYKQVSPLAWKGKMRWKKQLGSVISIRTIITISIFLFLAWGYQADNTSLIEFHNNVTLNTNSFCQAYYAGLSMTNPEGGNFQDLGEVKYGEATNSISDNS